MRSRFSANHLRTDSAHRPHDLYLPEVTMTIGCFTIFPQSHSHSTGLADPGIMLAARVRRSLPNFMPEALFAGIMLHFPHDGFLLFATPEIFLFTVPPQSHFHKVVPSKQISAKTNFPNLSPIFAATALHLPHDFVWPDVTLDGKALTSLPQSHIHLAGLLDPAVVSSSSFKRPKTDPGNIELHFPHRVVMPDTTLRIEMLAVLPQSHSHSIFLFDPVLMLADTVAARRPNLVELSMHIFLHAPHEVLFPDITLLIGTHAVFPQSHSQAFFF
jgi:hypothetical protein